MRAKCQRAIFQEERDEVSWAVDCLCILMLLHLTQHCFSLLQVLLLFKDYVPIGLDFFPFSVLALQSLKSLLLQFCAQEDVFIVLQPVLPQRYT